jgi:hypothetical protein
MLFIIIFTHTVKLRRIGQTEADGRLLWISQADERASWILEEGLGTLTHNLIPCARRVPVFLGLRCYRKTPMTRGSGGKRNVLQTARRLKPHPTPQGRRKAQPCTTSRDGQMALRSAGGKESGITEMTRHVFSDIVPILKWLKHMQRITCNHRQH